MARYVRQHWQGDLGVGISRRDRRSCEYSAYVPDSLVGRPIVLDGDVAADVADAERAIAQLDHHASTLVDTEALARILLRAESVASSRIEGLEVGSRRLLRAEMAQGLGESSDITATEILGNIAAMAWAVHSTQEGDAVSLDHVLDIHRRLLAGTRLETHGGRIRTTQNWIGGSDFNPCNAAYVPPPPEIVPGLLDDLVAFCNEESLPAIAQAAVAHLQFETIHPFADGNGRAGRALIHVVLRRRGLTTRVTVPVSLILATWSRSYIAGLVGARYEGEASSAAAFEGLNRWIGLFAAACTRAVEDASSFEARMHELEEQWRSRLGKVRAGSSVDLLLKQLPGAPILTVNSASELLGRTFAPVNEAIARLVEADILRQVRVGRRNRAFEAPAVIDAFTALERQLASPAADTRAALPVRPVPRLVR